MMFPRFAGVGLLDAWSRCHRRRLVRAQALSRGVPSQAADLDRCRPPGRAGGGGSGRMSGCAPGPTCQWKSLPVVDPDLAPARDPLWEMNSALAAPGSGPFVRGVGGGVMKWLARPTHDARVQMTADRVARVGEALGAVGSARRQPIWSKRCRKVAARSGGRCAAVPRRPVDVL